MRDAKALLAEINTFSEKVNQGRAEYAGGPKYFHHVRKKREAAWPWLSDHQIGDMVRMLMRGDIEHEAVVCAARDRIFHLSEEVDRLRALIGEVGSGDWTDAAYAAALPSRLAETGWFNRARAALTS